MLRFQSQRFTSAFRQYATISPHSYITNDFISSMSKEEISDNIKNLGPYPTYSTILNPQHYYQNEVLMNYARQLAHPVSLRQLAGYGKTLTKQKIISSANFVRMELPIRLALRIQDLQCLPFGVVNNYHLQKIYESYYTTFNLFRRLKPITTIADNERACRDMLNMLDAHMSNLPHLMMGALEISLHTNVGPEELDPFMSRILRSRILRRLIVEEHLLLLAIYQAEPYAEKSADFIGEIFNDCNAKTHLVQVHDLIKKTIDYPEPLMPDLIVDGDVDTTFPFIVPHLHYMFGEVLRNSLQATVKTQGDAARTKSLPPIKVLVVNGKKDVVFRISDHGGGIPQEKLDKIWLFHKLPEVARTSLMNFHMIPGLQLYSNLKTDQGGCPSQILTGNQAETALHQTSLVEVALKKSTLANLIERPHTVNLGLGLPMCKVYADYWNGDILMNSIEGFGSDTCLTLRKLGYHLNIVQLDKA